MAVVYEAEQKSLGRHVALKVLRTHSRLDPQWAARFRREARAAARLHHTNIVPVYGVGEHDGALYYVMQYIPGQALDEVLTAVGARVEQLPDGLAIEPGARRAALLDSYADHRMVHAAAVLGLAIEGVQAGNPGAVTKTLPDFVERWSGLLGEPVGAPS